MYDDSLKDSFYMGSQFWDITEALALALISNENDFRNKYRFASCSDEIFVQTFIQNTNFWNNLWIECKIVGNGMGGNMRYIDFSDEKNGSPHVMDISDINKLMESNLNFARKFDSNNMDAVQELIRRIQATEN